MAPKTNPKLVLNPAELRNQITIERATKTKAANGVVTPTWATFGTAWCSLTPLSMRWAMQDGQPQTPGLFKLRMRYLSGLLSTDRINFGGRIMQIKEVMNIDERNMTHELTVQENQSNG